MWKTPSKIRRVIFSIKKDLNAAWTGISTGFVDGAVDAWEGLISLGDKETWLNMKDAIVNYRETIPAAWNTVSDTFMNKFWNGDLESREHYVAYGIATIFFASGVNNSLKSFAFPSFSSSSGS